MTANAITTNQSHPLNGSGIGVMLTRYSKRPTTQPRIIRVTTTETRDSMPIEFPLVRVFGFLQCPPLGDSCLKCVGFCDRNQLILHAVGGLVNFLDLPGV